MVIARRSRTSSRNFSDRAFYEHWRFGECAHGAMLSVRHFSTKSCPQEPIDLHDYLHMPRKRIGRPPKHDLSRPGPSPDDWPERIPVTAREVDIFEAWFGDLFDELFGPGL